MESLVEYQVTFSIAAHHIQSLLFAVALFYDGITYVSTLIPIIYFLKCPSATGLN